MGLELRKYQQECLSEIEKQERGSYLVSMATGLGKTVVFSHIKARGRVLVISHREELVYQPIKYYDCPVGIEKANEHSHGEKVVLASVQTLINRLDNFKRDEFDLIITDEAHHAAAPSYKKIYNYFTPRLHIGFTATPNRGDKVRLDDVFDKIIFERNLRWGIENNYLTDIKCLRIKVSYNLNQVKRRMGDFVVADLDKAMNTDTSNLQIKEVYEKYAVGQTLIFASSVAHAENIASLIPGAVVVSQKTANRSKIIEDFTARKIKCLVNCMIFTEGTDLPLIETIIIARPTQNVSLYTQMVGRGLRKYLGKRYLTLIDLVGVSKMDICTAPSLAGIDIDDIPKGKELDLSGTMLLDMEKKIESLRDCPENWIMNVERVKMFAKAFGADTHNVNWSKKANGSLVFQFACGDRIGVSAVDELGQVKLMRYVYDEEKQGFVFTKTEDMSLQSAFDRAYEIFKNEYSDEVSLWDLQYYYSWSEQPATEKQIAMVKGFYKQEFDNLFGEKRLTKGDMSQIINMIKLKRTTPQQLAKMHEEHKNAVLQKQREIDKRKTMKIRYDINKNVTKKYYALILADELVITNSWQKAEELIENSEKLGYKPKFKGFPSLNLAIDFIRS